MAKGKSTATHPVTESKLVELIEKLDQGRSKLYVAAQALDHGDTDLELQCSTTLEAAFREIDEAYTELLGLRLHVRAHEEQTEGVAHV